MKLGQVIDKVQPQPIPNRPDDPAEVKNVLPTRGFHDVAEHGVGDGNAN
jgi:hypothetical protein